jgi:hypothetical protein
MAGSCSVKEKHGTSRSSVTMGNRNRKNDESEHSFFWCMLRGRFLHRNRKNTVDVIEW